MKPRDKDLGLTAERLRELFSYDPGSGLFIWRKKPHKSASNISIGDVAGSLDNTGYIRIWIDGKRYVAHRLAWLYTHGKWPEHQIDHIDRNRINNCLPNLREASHHQNMVNRSAKSDNSCKQLGVSKHSVKWYQARIQRNGKTTSLGLFKTIKEAGEAYKQASRKVDGEFSP